MTRAFLAIAALSLLGGCSGAPSDGEISSQSSASTAAVGTTNGTLSPPPAIANLSDDRIRNEALQAKIQSDYLDSLCAGAGMSPDLAPYRPNGTGCPRPLAVGTNGGAR
jgi:hypothetical protein